MQQMIPAEDLVIKDRILSEGIFIDKQGTNGK